MALVNHGILDSPYPRFQNDNTLASFILFLISYF